MKILISLILLALIYFLFRKFTAGKSTPEQLTSAATPTDTLADSNTDAELDDSAAVEPSATVSAAAATETPIATETASASSVQASTTSSTASPPSRASQSLPIEHLEGIDRRTGKTLRALGINDLDSLVVASNDTLEAAGFQAAAAKVLRAQAALSTLSGITPSEVSVLAKSGIDSIANLAEQDPAGLLARVAQTNRGSSALKSAPGVQQLQRLISSAKAAA